MSSAPILASSSPPGRSIELSWAAAHGVVAIALVVVALAGASIVLPVSITLSARAPTIVGGVDLAVAAAVVLVVSIAARATAAIISRNAVEEPERGARRLRAVRYLELSQVAGITLFLVAQLNGVSEAGTLVLCYAVSAASVSVLWLQGRALVESRRSAWPYSVGAVIAIVPWGVVALSQIVAIVVGAPPAPIVRVLTIVVLLLSAAAWLIERRWQIGALGDERAAAAHAAVTLANGLALLVITVGLARPSALL